MVWPPKTSHSFIQNLLDNSASFTPGRTIDVCQKWKIKLIFRGAWNSLMAWPVRPWPPILRQIYATASGRPRPLAWWIVNRPCSCRYLSIWETRSCNAFISWVSAATAAAAKFYRCRQLAALVVYGPSGLMNDLPLQVMTTCCEPVAGLQQRTQLQNIRSLRRWVMWFPARANCETEWFLWPRVDLMMCNTLPCFKSHLKTYYYRYFRRHVDN